MRKDRVISEVFGEESVLAPSELSNKTFGKALFGGYAKGQVHAFLHQVADVVERLNEEIRTLKERQDTLRSELAGHREIEAGLREALVAAQRVSEDVIASAKREAEAILAEARVARDRALVDAAEIPAGLRQEIDALRRQRDGLRRDIEAALDGHRRLLAASPDGATGNADDANTSTDDAEEGSNVSGDMDGAPTTQESPGDAGGTDGESRLRIRFSEPPESAVRSEDEASSDSGDQQS